jgi:DNA polymerase III sliding clamp (beta) subunit (PCNA family)
VPTIVKVNINFIKTIIKGKFVYILYFMAKRFFETNKGIRGGMLKGKAHYDSEGNSLGGIKAIVTDQGGTPVELEGNEVIINKKTVQSDKVLTVKGTPKEILSTLNQMEGNGVAIGDEEAEILAKYREGGELIKRADGSYSRRGLWDNIRDNIGSGRKPTKQMLEQEAKIKSKYHLGGDMSKHLAPNGKPSKLTHEQWHLVRTPEFKAWFGDWEKAYETLDYDDVSKVLDENCEPLVVYHGTPNDFEKNKNEVVFDIKKAGAHFGTKEQANDFFPFKIYECFLNIRNIQLGVDEEILVNQIIDDLQSEYGTDFLSIRMMKEVEQLTPSYSEQLKSGFDGLKYINIMEGDQKSFSYVVFNPNQIKLADGSNNTFDANNDDIRFKTGGSIGDMTPSEIKAFYDTPEGRKLDAETYSEWKSLVNMSKSEITNFYNSPEGKQAGLSESEASKHGIDSGRESAEWIMKMKDIPYKLWSSDMWRWAKKQISFIKRMSGMKGELYDDKGRKTRKHTALLIWGHKPNKKFEGGGSIKNENMEKEIQPIQKDLFGSENESQITIFDLNEEKFAKGGEISTSSFYAKKEVFNWNEIPSTWKNTNKVAKVNLKLDPSDDKFNSVFQKFLSTDQLREIVTGFNVDDNGITATNFHVLITVPTTEDLEKGVSLKGKKIEGAYPNYGAVIPREFASIHKFDCYKLLQYCRVALNYCNKTTKQIAVKVDDSLLGFNADYLINTLETSLKLGHQNLYFHFSSPDRAGVFSTVENPTLGKDIIILIMPVMVNDAYDDKRVFGAMDIDYGLKLACHFNFNKNNIINGDGSVADFKMDYGENPIFTKQVIEALKENIGKKNIIDILDNFVVEDDKAIVVNMVDEGYTLKINNITAPKGIYYVSNDVAVYSTDEKDYSEFPDLIQESPFLNRLTINSDYFKWLLDTLEIFKGDDDLRPVMMGLSIIYDSYKLTFASTDAHKLGRIVSNDSVVFENKNSFKVILPFNRIADLLNLSSNEDIVLEINESNLKIVTDKFECDNRLIDGKYPNYDAVIPQDSKNKLTLNKEQLLKALKTKEAENFIKKYKKSVSIIGKKEGDNLLVSLYIGSSKERDFSIVDSIDILTTDLKLDEESYKSTTESCLLLMPVKVDVEHLFSFKLAFFKDLIKPISSNSFDLNYSDESKAYIVNSNDFDYTKAISKPKAVKKEVVVVPEKNKTLLQSAIDKDKNWGERIYKSNSLDELNELIEYLGKTHYLEELRDATSRRNYVQRHELDKGTEHEMEHLATLKKVAEGKVTPEEAVVETAKTHIAENPEYYEDLAKMEKENKNETYTYALTIRPFNIGTYPEENFIRLIKENYKFGLLEYSKPLSDRDIKHYSLAPVSELMKYDGKEYYYYEDLKAKINVIRDEDNTPFAKVTEFDENNNLVQEYTINANDFLQKIESLNYRFIDDSAKMESENEESIPELIEGLKLLAESLEGTEKKEIEDVIEGLEILLESDDKFEKGGEFRMATGGKIVFKPITTPL